MFSLKVTHAHSWEMLSTKDSIFQLAVEDLAWGSFLLHRNHYEQVSLCSNQSGNKTERPDDEALSLTSNLLPLMWFIVLGKA